jgi:tyrosine-specific transport protein
MPKKRLFHAVATLVGCMMGAGILAIPYVVAQAGFITGAIDIIVLGLIFILLNLYLGEVILRTKGTHQLTAYAEKYTGKIGRRFMFVSMVVGIYGAIIAYIMGGGAALSSLTGLDSLLCSVIFFGALSGIVYVGLGAIEESEAIAMPLVLAIVLIIVIFGISKANSVNLTEFSFSNLMIPYGVVLFALIGSSSIPEMKEELEKEKKSLKKAIIIGSTIPIIVYLLFAFAIVGALGKETYEIGALGLTAILGEKMAFLGAIFAMMTMSTAFLALGLALKELFWYDYGLRKNTSWLLACFVPFLLFVLVKLGNLADFVTILDVAGIITGAITGILVVLMVINAKKKGERKPEYSIYINKFIAFALIALFIIGALNLLLS